MVLTLNTFKYEHVIRTYTDTKLKYEQSLVSKTIESSVKPPVILQVNIGAKTQFLSNA